MREGEEELYWQQEADDGPSGLRRVGLLMFIIAVAVVFVVSLLVSL